MARTRLLTQAGSLVALTVLALFPPMAPAKLTFPADAANQTLPAERPTAIDETARPQAGFDRGYEPRAGPSSSAGGGGGCPADRPLVNCLTDPCTFTTCMVPMVCQSDYCGGCTATCVGPPAVPRPAGGPGTASQTPPEEVPTPINETEASGPEPSLDIKPRGPRGLPPGSTTGAPASRSPGAGGGCPADRPVVNCLTDPCSFARCAAPLVCQSDYCGGCFATCVAAPPVGLPASPGTASTQNETGAGPADALLGETPGCLAARAPCNCTSQCCGIGALCVSYNATAAPAAAPASGGGGGSGISASPGAVLAAGMQDRVRAVNSSSGGVGICMSWQAVSVLERRLAGPVRPARAVVGPAAATSNRTRGGSLTVYNC